MSCTIEIIIACDICGENNGGDDRHKSARQIRTDRKREGWVYRDGNDFCPKCAEELRQARKGTLPMDKLVDYITQKAKQRAKDG